MANPLLKSSLAARRSSDGAGGSSAFRRETFALSDGAARTPSPTLQKPTAPGHLGQDAARFAAKHH
jgi:hypothetical protein